MNGGGIGDGSSQQVSFRPVTELPLISAPIAEVLTEARRAVVERNLGWVEGQGLILEVTGQERFRL